MIRDTFFAIAVLILSTVSPVDAQSLVPEQSVTITAGTQLQVVLVRPLFAVTSHVGDAVSVNLIRSVAIHDEVVLPEGTPLLGHIVTRSWDAVQLTLDSMAGTAIPIQTTTLTLKRNRVKYLAIFAPSVVAAMLLCGHRHPGEEGAVCVYKVLLPAGLLYPAFGQLVVTRGRQLVFRLIRDVTIQRP